MYVLSSNIHIFPTSAARSIRDVYSNLLSEENLISLTQNCIGTEKSYIISAPSTIGDTGHIVFKLYGYYIDVNTNGETVSGLFNEIGSNNVYAHIVLNNINGHYSLYGSDDSDGKYKGVQFLSTPDGTETHGLTNPKVETLQLISNGEINSSVFMSVDGGVV